MNATPSQLHVCIATPCYDGAVFQNYMLSIIKLVYACANTKVSLSFIIRGGDSLITRCRNSIVAEFLSATEYTHMFCIDADIGFEPQAFFRLLNSGHDVCAGVYPLKFLNWPDQLPARLSRDDFVAANTAYAFNPVAAQTQMPADGFVRVLDVPSGFMVIRRSVLEQLASAYPELKYRPDDQPGLGPISDCLADNHYCFFDTMRDDSGRYLSEGYAFCRRWQNVGGDVYADLNSRLTHRGSHLYEGDFLRSLQTWSKGGSD